MGERGIYFIYLLRERESTRWSGSGVGEVEAQEREADSPAAQRA